jgi:hypothetical protein
MTVTVPCVICLKMFRILHDIGDGLYQQALGMFAHRERNAATCAASQCCEGDDGIFNE